MREGDVLHVSWSWGGDPVSICMNALMAIGFGGLGLAGLLGEFEVPARQALVPWSFLVMSLFLGYEVLLRLVNRTSVEASPRTGISVRHGPLPWFVLPSVVEARDLYQLYGQKCAELVRGRIRQVYQLRVLCRDGRSRKLVSKELSAEQVLFLERTLEAHLGVRDAPVPGELKAESVS
ncbi:hypothetical protein JQX13_26370 [Archangium violaceum]|uniref:hypothetical protein n=1 Tax=Archangium violaceum TaxID=83451 RepID=UPI00193B46F0|nr:hypothetical protein [Archangium violaceum]QRK13245.1 hypothetical protein JQX13_26370 [Archangium violaceum]